MKKISEREKSRLSLLEREALSAIGSDDPMALRDLIEGKLASARPSIEGADGEFLLELALAKKSMAACNVLLEEGAPWRARAGSLRRLHEARPAREKAKTMELWNAKALSGDENARQIAWALSPPDDEEIERSEALEDAAREAAASVFENPDADGLDRLGAMVARSFGGWQGEVGLAVLEEAVAHRCAQGCAYAVRHGASSAALRAMAMATGDRGFKLEIQRSGAMVHMGLVDSPGYYDPTPRIAPPGLLK